MMKQYTQMSREELEDALNVLIQRKEIDPDTGTVLFIDESGAVILDRFEEPKYSIMQIRCKSIEDCIGLAKEFDPFAEIIYSPLMEFEVKSAYSNYRRKQEIAERKEDFMTYIVGNA